MCLVSDPDQYKVYDQSESRFCSRSAALNFSMIDSYQKRDNDVSSVSDPDPNPCGSVLEWLPWIRIQDSQNGVQKGRNI